MKPVKLHHSYADNFCLVKMSEKSFFREQMRLPEFGAYGKAGRRGEDRSREHSRFYGNFGKNWPERRPGIYGHCEVSLPVVNTMVVVEGGGSKKTKTNNPIIRVHKLKRTT